MTALGEVAGWDPSKILRNPAARTAIRQLGRALRTSGFVNHPGAPGATSALSSMARGEPVEAYEAALHLGGELSLGALLETGAADCDAENVFTLRFSVLAGAGAMAILPRPGLLVDGVYAGSDSWLLVQQAWRFGLGGARALDLGTGTGLVASFLSSRYNEVIAADVSAVSATTAALGRELLSEQDRSRLGIVVNDVTSGLVPRSFDLVVANTPWVPSLNANGQTFADGGPTGTELPLRFLREGVTMLAPGGLLVLLCSDLRESDDSGPLVDALAELEALGLKTSVEVTPRGAVDFEFQDAPESFEGFGRLDHVTVVVY
ncbi:MAG: methyltransferase [Actinomycetes bacterium]